MFFGSHIHTHTHAKALCCIHLTSVNKHPKETHDSVLSMLSLPFQIQGAMKRTDGGACTNQTLWCTRSGWHLVHCLRVWDVREPALSLAERQFSQPGNCSNWRIVVIDPGAVSATQHMHPTNEQWHFPHCTWLCSARGLPTRCLAAREYNQNPPIKWLCKTIPFGRQKHLQSLAKRKPKNRPFRRKQLNIILWTYLKTRVLPCR